MLIISITLLTVLIPGVAVGFFAYRWPQAAPTAPKISVQKVEHEARRHPRLVAFTRSRLDPGSATGLLLSAAIVVFVVGTALMAIVLVMIHTNTGFARLDRSVSLFGAHHATALSTRFLRFYTQLGGALVIVPLGVIVAIAEAIRQRSVAIVAFLTLVVGGQFLVANVIKAIVDRARPNFDQLTGFSGPSFPSGHAVATAGCLAAFALVIGRRRSIKVRAILAGLAVGLATGIACCRVMLGVHWLTDVLGGLALGWAWFALCSIAFGGYQLRFGAPAKTAEETVTS
jgi:membrane-associated phospholipid phosphatase